MGRCSDNGSSEDGVELGGDSGEMSIALKVVFMHISDVRGSSRKSWGGVLWYGSF